MPKMFKTTVLGVGPYCVEFDSGEIVHTRQEDIQRLIAAAPSMLKALKAMVAYADQERKGLRIADEAIAMAEISPVTQTPNATQRGQNGIS